MKSDIWSLMLFTLFGSSLAFCSSCFLSSSSSFFVFLRFPSFLLSLYCFLHSSSSCLCLEDRCIPARRPDLPWLILSFALRSLIFLSCHSALRSAFAYALCFCISSCLASCLLCPAVLPSDPSPLSASLVFLLYSLPFSSSSFS